MKLTDSDCECAEHSDLDCRIVSKKDFQTSVLGQEHNALISVELMVFIKDSGT